MEFKVGGMVVWNDTWRDEANVRRYGDGPFEIIRIKRVCGCRYEHIDPSQCSSPCIETLSVKTSWGKTFKRRVNYFKPA